MSIDDTQLTQRLAERLAKPLPGFRVQQALSPELTYSRHFGPPAYDARYAGVAILLYRCQRGWCIPLTARPDTMAHHAGQISLPGGQIEDGETSEQAALRELHEELGIPSNAVEVIGPLSQLYVYGSNFVVMPWIVVERGPLEFRPNTAEVAELIELSLAELLDPRHRGIYLMQKWGVELAAPSIACGRHRIWGATCMILGELAAICEDCV